MAFTIGFLVGSLLLLAAVLYFTRVRNPAVPGLRGDASPPPGPETETCDLCERERICETVGDLTVCAECNDDLMT
ncbi:MAG: hypothetical protein ABEJ78_10665 [Haloferacaceae archaeon]